MFKSHKKQIMKELERAEQAALEAIGLYVESRAKLLTPVDTGRLRDSIDHFSDKEKATIGTAVEYAVFIEKGTSKQVAQPYLTPAVEDNIKEINRLASKTIKDMMK